MYFFQRVTAFFTTLVAIITAFFGIGAIRDKKVDDFKVTTYIRADYVQSEDSLFAEDFDIITDVILFEAARFDNEGNVVLESNFVPALENIRKAIAGRDIHLTLNLLGPWGHTDSDIWEEQMEAQSDEHNKAFASGVLEDNIIAVLEQYGFDGVHFDYEYPISNKAWKHYNKFLVSLDKKLGDKYTLGVAGNDWNLKFSTAAIKAIDTLEVMTYDFVDSQGRHATFEGTVDLIKKIGLYGIPLEKVNIGLPFYSRPTDMTTYWYGYNGCVDGIDENGWYHCEQTGKDFWFNTPDVIAAKTDYAIVNGYGGVMIWHYNCDVPSTNEKSLLKAIGDTVESNY